MALQNQTYANSGNGYYIQGADPFNPSTNTALYGPVEILFTSTIAGQFYGELNQTPSTFTISENNTSLSTINSLVMDPTVPKTTMNIYNYATNGEPVIQQWSHTSSIVNGVFKVGNKQLNDEPSALVFSNLANATEITQGANNMVSIIDGVNSRTVFTNNADRQNNVIINQAGGAPAVTVKDNANNSIVTQPTVQTFNRTGITYGRTGVNSAIPNQYFMSARTQMDFVTDETGVAPTVLSLKQNGTANFISTVFAPTVSSITTTTTRARIQSQPAPNTYIPPADNEAQLQQGVIGGVAGGPPFAPSTATNSLEIVASSGLTDGGVQFFNAKSGTFPPEWMGGFLKNPKSFNVAPGYVANLAGNVSTPFVFASVSVSTPVIRVSNFVETGPGSYISTPVLNATLSTITTNAIAGFSHKTPNSVITNANSATPPPGPYPTAYGNFQGQLMYNTLRDSYGAPATAFESLEVVNVAGGPQTGGIQFYTSDNSNPANPKWMGGFLQNNVGGGQSEFRLASTITASMPQLVNVSTINTLPITAYGVPVGTMLNWAGNNPASVPGGYLLCDGSYVSKTTYSALYAVINSWGPEIGNTFRLPDSRGKTQIGSLTSGFQVGSSGAYAVTANYQSLVSINLPSTWGGGTRVGMYITNPTGQIFPGMICLSPFDGSVYVVGIINSDGLYGNQQPVPPAGTSNRATIVIFNNNMTISGPSPATVTFETDSFYNDSYPFIRKSWDPTVGNFGVGSYYQLQHEYEVGGHNHVQQQGGVQGTAGLGPRSGDPNVGGPNTNINNGLFSYIDPVTSITITAPLAMFNLPYNIATFQIIKY